MTDLSPEQERALVEALERGGDSTELIPGLITTAGPDEYNQLTPAGRLLAQAIKERNEARANYQFMVERAANERLDGYRELGARAAKAENDSVALRAHVAELKATWGQVRRRLLVKLLRERAWVLMLAPDTERQKRWVHWCNETADKLEASR